MVSGSVGKNSSFIELTALVPFILYCSKKRERVKERKREREREILSGHFVRALLFNPKAV